MKRFLIPLNKAVDAEPQQRNLPLTDDLTYKDSDSFDTHLTRKKQKLNNSNKCESDSENIPTQDKESIFLDQDLPVSKSTWERWKSQYPWISLSSSRKVVCLICTEATEKNLLLGDSLTCRSGSISLEAFVTSGFNCWTNAITRYRNHESSSLHTEAVNAINNFRKRTNIAEQISTTKQREMLDSRTALSEIFHTILMLAQQGLPLRGNNDERSNLLRVLRLLARRVPELQTWLNREREMAEP
ncbi:uncharacterized protein LOC107046501 [Diachasma alloeum]|uniref:uncharacterized protein LOC107046501 n=1 Tax=Diachasma alloeum TaxID=454923 RepID=UPI0007384168|nr:uncharacterized protein LOC107046501 [Diachasma alloeum]